MVLNHLSCENFGFWKEEFLVFFIFKGFFGYNLIEKNWILVRSLKNTIISDTIKTM